MPGWLQRAQGREPPPWLERRRGGAGRDGRIRSPDCAADWGWLPGRLLLPSHPRPCFSRPAHACMPLLLLLPSPPLLPCARSRPAPALTPAPLPLSPQFSAMRAQACRRLPAPCGASQGRAPGAPGRHRSRVSEPGASRRRGHSGLLAIGAESAHAGGSSARLSSTQLPPRTVRLPASLPRSTCRHEDKKGGAGKGNWGTLTDEAE